MKSKMCCFLQLFLQKRKYRGSLSIKLTRILAAMIDCKSAKIGQCQQKKMHRWRIFQKYKYYISTYYIAFLNSNILLSLYFPTLFFYIIFLFRIPLPLPSNSWCISLVRLMFHSLSSSISKYISRVERWRGWAMRSWRSASSLGGYVYKSSCNSVVNKKTKSFF